MTHLLTRPVAIKPSRSRRSPLRQNRVWITAVSLVVFLAASPAFAQQALWTNPSTGNGAGDWFDISNWNPMVVPDLNTDVRIDNGGEALATTATATGNVNADVLSIGPNGTEGIFTSEGVDVLTGGDLEIAQTFLVGAATAIGGFGIATLTDMNIIDIGSDVEVAKSFGAETSSSLTTGVLTVERVESFLIDDDLEIGEAVANGNASAQTSGFVTLEDVETIEIGRGVDVGQAATADSGLAVGDGSLNVTRAVSFITGRAMMIGEAIGSNSGNTSATGIATLTDVAAVEVAGDLGVGIAETRSNTAQATADGDLSLTGVSSLLIEDDLRVGVTQSSITGGILESTGIVNISIAPGAEGNGQSIEIGEDLEVGTSSFSGSTSSDASGELIVTGFDSLDIDDMVEIGTARTGGLVTATVSSTNSTLGTATLTDIASITVGQSMDVGRSGNRA